jgi:hypothetical protein
MVHLRMPSIALLKIAVQANYGFATIFAALKLAGLQNLWRIAGQGKRYGSPKNGLSGVNHLVTAVRQSWAILQRNCCMRRWRLEKTVTVPAFY